MQLTHRLAELAGLSAVEVGRYLGPEVAPARGDAGPPGSAQAGGSRWREPRRFVPRVPVGKPDLEARIRLLTALHPALAAAERGEWMPGPLAAWFDTLVALPPGSAFASVCEALRHDSPEAVARLEREAASDASAAAALSFDEARVEVEAALAQLRERHLARLIDELVAGGMASPEERQRYQSLMAMRRRT